MPALQRLAVRWQVVWGMPPEQVTDTTVWTDLPLADYAFDLGASFGSADTFPRPKPAAGRITIISRNGIYSRSATVRPVGAVDRDLLQRRSAIRWQWRDPNSATWQTRWTGALTDLEDSGNDEVSARLQSAQTEDLAARTSIEAGDTTGATLLTRFGVVIAVAPPQDTLLTLPEQRRRTMTILSDLAEVMASWPIELHTGQFCVMAPADVTVARMNAAPLLDLYARATGPYRVEACDTMRTSRVRYKFPDQSGSQDFDTLMETLAVSLSSGRSLDVTVNAPQANQNFLWKSDYETAVDMTAPTARLSSRHIPSTAVTPVPGYGSPPVAINAATNPTLRSRTAFLRLIPYRTPGTSTTHTFRDGVINVRMAIPTAAVMSADLRVTVSPSDDSRSARVVIRNVGTSPGRTVLSWSGAWRDVPSTRVVTYTSERDAVFVHRGHVEEGERQVAWITANWRTRYPLAVRFISARFFHSGNNPIKVWHTVTLEVGGRFARTQPWRYSRVVPPTYHYRGSLPILANRQTEVGRGGDFIYARNPTLATDDAEASPQEWWRDDDLVSAQRLADTLAIPRTFLRCTVLDWPLVGETTAHTISTCDIIRISFDDTTRNITVQAPFAVIGMQHQGEVGSPGQTTLRLLSLTRPPEAPTRIVVSRSGQTLRGSWVEEETIWGSKALGTDVQYRLTTDVAWTDATRVAAGTRTFSGLSARRASGTWEVRLRTVSTAGVGLWSDPVSE